jgi:hypothetical protein
MSQPFFSVIIPTRNRSDLVASAVASVLNQTFNNYELIVSDNSDDQVPLLDALTKLEGWRNNPRCKLIRPASYMHMPDHWEFCNEYASGEYVLILTDRFVMRPSSLQVLADKIRLRSDTKPDVVLWNVQSSFDDETKILTTQSFSSGVSELEPHQILRDFVSFSSWETGSLYFNNLPRGMNSAYRRCFGAKLKAKYGRIFPALSPDYSSAFLFLAYANKALCVDLPFYVSHGLKSTGMNSMIYGIHMLSADVDPLQGCPLQIDTVVNTVVRDFLSISELVYPQLESVSLNVAAYFLENYREIIFKELLGSPMNTKQMYKTLDEKVLGLSPCEQEEIRSGMLVLDKMRATQLNALRFKLTRSLGLQRFKRSFDSISARRNHKHDGGVIYSNVLQAATITDDYLV